MFLNYRCHLSHDQRREILLALSQFLTSFTPSQLPCPFMVTGQLAPLLCKRRGSVVFPPRPAPIVCSPRCWERKTLVRDLLRLTGSEVTPGAGPGMASREFRWPHTAGN